MPPLRILLVHCAYQLRGGEDSVVEAEMALLQAHGHEVRLLIRQNADIEHMPTWQVARDTIWSPRSARDLAEATRGWRPDVMHVHNTTLLLSPSIFWAARKQGIPVVQTLHNFRTACLSATFLRNGQVCEQCLGHAPWRGVVHGCYRGSKAQSMVLASSIMAHRWMHTSDHIDAYIALTQFSRQKLIDAGLPAERLHVKPNFVDGGEPPATTGRSGALYVGRLTEEKGVHVLQRAVASCPLALTVLGTGPMEDALRRDSGIRVLGQAPLPEVLRHMETASVLVMPSLWYEGFPRTLVEAFARGLPVIASRLGSMAEIIEDGHTGLLIPPGDASALQQALQWAHDNPERLAQMGTNARRAYETRFAPTQNHQMLRQIYDQAIRRACPPQQLGNDPHSSRSTGTP